MSILTWRQAHAYAGPEALWRDVIAKNDSSWLALDSLAYRLTYQPNTTPTQLEEAAELYARVQQLRPQHPLLQQNWGDALFKLGQWSEALAHYEMALPAPGTDRRVVEDRMGIALGHLHQFNRAEEQFRLALAIDPADAAARSDLAEVLAAQGRTLEASGEYDLVLQAHPEMPAAWLGSAKVMLALNRPADAADRLARYVQLAPEDADGHERLGQLDLQLGRPSAAVKQFAAAVALRPDSDVAKQELTQAIAAEGKAGQ